MHGTVNDLAVAGAVPKYLTLNAFIEEGLEVETLERIIVSLAGAAREYYRDRAAFPATPSDLTGEYLDPGLNSQTVSVSVPRLVSATRPTGSRCPYYV